MNNEELIKFIQQSENIEYCDPQETNYKDLPGIDIDIKKGAFNNSKYFNEKIEYTVILPPGYSTNKKYPILYLLHGRYATHNVWVDEVKIVDIYKNLLNNNKIEELIIVCVDSGFKGESFYINFANNLKKRYENFFVKEFIPSIEKDYSVYSNPEKRGISGFSMGGFGAFNFGLKYPHLFNKISSLAGVLNLARRVSKKREFGDKESLIIPENYYIDSDAQRAFISVFGNDVSKWKNHNPYSLLKNICKTDLKLLKDKNFYIEVGENDFGMVPEFIDIHYLLEKHKLNYTAKVIKNEEHSWEYVRRSIPKILIFHVGKY